MKFCFNHIVGFLGALTLSVFCLGSSCNNSVEPVEPKDYPFYFGNLNPSQVLRFFPRTGVLDTTSITYFPYPGATLSADGKLLYITQGNSVKVVETETYSLVTELFYPQEYPVVVSADNRLIALTGDSLFILRTSDYSLVFSDTVACIYGKFEITGAAFYCPIRISGGLNEVYRVDLSDRIHTVTRKAFSERNITHVCPSNDGAKWFLYSGVSADVSAFEVCDASDYSIIFTDFLSPGYGRMALSPDGQKVFYTNPGRTSTSTPSDLSINIYDVNSNQIDTVIKEPGYFSDSFWVAPPNQLSITPDGRYLGILGGSMALTALFVMDIENKKLIFRLEPGFQLAQYTVATTQ